MERERERVGGMDGEEGGGGETERGGGEDALTVSREPFLEGSDR